MMTIPDWTRTPAYEALKAIIERRTDDLSRKVDRLNDRHGDRLAELAAQVAALAQRVDELENRE